MIWLGEDYTFPPVETANEDGIVALGGDLSFGRLIEAYTHGIFPWYDEGQPILWWSPDPRMVLYPKEIYINKNTRKSLNKGEFNFTINQSFEEVINQCRTAKRKGQKGTWITHEMMEAYIDLHHRGFAKSVEVWKENHLVGGLYGIDLGNVFCGESMFSKVTGASRAGFTWFAQQHEDVYNFIDCQVYNDYLATFGAKEIPRKQFIENLNKALNENR